MDANTNGGLAGCLILTTRHLNDTFLLAFPVFLGFANMSSNLNADTTASEAWQNVRCGWVGLFNMRESELGR